MFEYQYYNPVKVVFGRDSIKQLNEVLNQYNKRVLVITYESVKQVYTEIVQKKIDNSYTIEIFSKIETNPPLEMINEAIALAKEFKPDVIITIGGGSCHDVGKILSFMITHEGKVEEYTVTGIRGIPAIRRNIIPLITIPTICGTGAEISPAALLKINEMKEVIFSPNLYPNYSIIDSNLMDNTSELIAAVGFDAFVQAIEPYVAKNSQPFSDMYALDALKNIVEYLPKLISDPNDISAREFVALSSLQGIYAISPTGVGAIHALSNPLSGKYNIHHGVALAMLTKEVIDMNYTSNIDKFANISRILDKGCESLNKEQQAEICGTLAQKFIDKIGLGKLKKLRDYGVSAEDVDWLVKKARNGDIIQNPKELSNDDIEKIYKNI